MPSSLAVDPNCAFGAQVDTGQLSLNNYLEQLRTGIRDEKLRALELKGKGATKKAIEALKHAKVMEQELAEALAQGE